MYMVCTQLSWNADRKTLLALRRQSKGIKKAVEAVWARDVLGADLTTLNIVDFHRVAMTIRFNSLFKRLLRARRFVKSPVLGLAFDRASFIYRHYTTHRARQEICNFHVYGMQIWPEEAEAYGALYNWIEFAREFL